MNNLGDIQWIFNKTKGIDNIQTLKTNVLNSLKKADGKPIEEIRELFKNDKSINKIQQLFGKDIESANDLLKKLEDNQVFNQIFEITE